MGKTAYIMNIKQALEMRTAIATLIRLTDADHYCVAIAERMPATEDKEPDYELHMYTRDPKKSGLISLALLANAIEDMGTTYMTIDSTYDAGTTKGTDIRNSIKIW